MLPIPCESTMSLSHKFKLWHIFLSSTVSEEECSADDLCYDNVRCILDDEEEDDAEPVSGFDCECPCNDGFYCSLIGECEGNV